MIAHLVALAALAILLTALGAMHVGLYVVLVAAWLSFYAATGLLARLIADIGNLLRGDF